MKYPGSGYWRGLNSRVTAVKLSVPALFVLGYLLSFRAFPRQWMEYLLLTAAAAAAGCLAVKALTGRKGTNAAAWLVFFLLLLFGYAKFYWLAVDPAPIREFFTEWTSWRHFEVPATLLDAFLMQTLGFAGFCLSVFFLPTRLKDVPEQGVSSYVIGASALRYYFCAITGLLIGSIWLVYKFKIGFMGMVSEPLPLHLSGLIFYSHTMVLPILIISAICLAEAARKYFWSRAGMALFILWALADVILRSSRASLMLVPLLLLFLSIGGGIKVRKAEALAGFGIGFMAIILSPLIWSYRVSRLSGCGSFAALKASVSSFSFTTAGLAKSISFIFFRVPGIDIPVIISGFKVKILGAEAFDVLFSEKGYSWYIGHSAFGLPFDAPNGFATPFIGQWYMAWGYPGIMLAGIAVGVFSVAAWNSLLKCCSPLAPVARAFFLLLFFWGFTEGVAPALFKQVFVASAALLFGELLVLNFLLPGDKET